jgi:hypothetical protein
MNVPGFTAEASLCTPLAMYRPSGGSGGTIGAVQPAYYQGGVSCEPCNGVLGWRTCCYGPLLKQTCFRERCTPILSPPNLVGFH